MSQMIDTTLARQIAAATRQAAERQSKSLADDLATLRRLDAAIEREKASQQDTHEEEEEDGQQGFRFIGATLNPSEYKYAGHLTHFRAPDGEMIEDDNVPEDCPYITSDRDERRCNICNHKISQLAFIRHIPTGELHMVGHDCMHTILGLSYDEAGRKDMSIRKHQADKKAAKRKAVFDANPGLEQAIAVEHKIIRSRPAAQSPPPKDAPPSPLKWCPLRG